MTNYLLSPKSSSHSLLIFQIRLFLSRQATSWNLPLEEVSSLASQALLCMLRHPLAGCSLEEGTQHMFCWHRGKALFLLLDSHGVYVRIIQHAYAFRAWRVDGMVLAKLLGICDCGGTSQPWGCHEECIYPMQSSCLMDVEYTLFESLCLWQYFHMMCETQRKEFVPVQIASRRLAIYSDVPWFIKLSHVLQS